MKRSRIDQKNLMQIKYSSIRCYIWVVSRFWKKTSFQWTLQIVEKKKEILFVKTFIYKKHVIQKDQKTEMKIHMNISVKMNVISQRFIIKQDMSLLNINFSRFIRMNDQSIYCYDVYKMCYWLRDSWSIEKKDISIFYAIDKKESLLILSMLSMQFKHIWIDMIARTWCFDMNKHAFKLFIAEDFAKALQDEFTMYAFIMINVVKKLIIEHQVKAMNNVMNCITNALEMQTLFVELKEYKDVFLTESVDKLLLHEDHDHAIEITAKLLYESLYNLSNIKLATLRQYLDDILAKEWIKHFISSTDASILFILKKNDSLYLCMNYQDLNKITVKNHHLLSLISETLDRFKKVKQFIKLNLKNIYHHFRIQRENEWKTMFRTRYDHFKYMIILFNLINTFIIFQTYINKILTKLLNDFYVVYLNDILIFFIEKTDHVDYVK